MNRKLIILILFLLLPILVKTVNYSTNGSITIDQVDVVPPQILTISPADKSVDVSITTALIQLTFSEEMDISTLSTSSFYLMDSNRIKEPIMSHGPSTTSYSIRPAGPLKQGELYTLVVNATFTDVVGNTLDGNKNGISEGSPVDDIVTTFTTEIRPVDTIPPTILSTNPSDGEINVPISFSTFGITFSEEMDISTLKTNSFRIYDSRGIEIPISSHGPSLKSYSIFSPQPLQEGESYTAIVNATFSDVAGNLLDGNNNGISEGSPVDDVIFSFTTETRPPDPLPPIVTSTSPYAGETNVEVTISSISLSFSEEMDVSTLTTTSFYVLDSAGTQMLIISHGPSSTSYSIAPGEPLKSNEIYTVFVNATFTDIAGNTLDGNRNGISEGSQYDDIVFKFSTGNEDTNWDTDKDSIMDSDEAIYGLDPLDWDAFRDNDGDGFTNSFEILTNHGINDAGDYPNEIVSRISDQDGDLVPDDWEIFYGFSMNDAADAYGDKDNDGYPNRLEYRIGSDPTNPNFPWTNYLINDTEPDSMDDGWEILHGLDPNSMIDSMIDSDGDGVNNLMEFKLGTDPNNIDSDEDGMEDGWEINNHLNPLVTGDNYLDFDGDKYVSLEEFIEGTDPNNSLDAPVTHISSLITTDPITSTTGTRTTSTSEVDISKLSTSTTDQESTIDNSNDSPTLPIPLNLISSLVGLVLLILLNRKIRFSLNLNV